MLPSVGSYAPKLNLGANPALFFAKLSVVEKKTITTVSSVNSLDGFPCGIVYVDPVHDSILDLGCRSSRIAGMRIADRLYIRVVSERSDHSGCWQSTQNF